jgi:GTP cyclohydrolase I
MTTEKHTKPISEIIREQLKEDGVKYFSNDNIGEYFDEKTIELLVDEVTEKMKGVLYSLVIDTENDHNTNDTARRVAKMFIKEIFAGRYEKKPSVTSFPNASKYDGLYVTGPITIRSTCAHHMMPIVGKAYIGVLPGDDVIGLSKFNRLTDWIVSRPQIQEEMTMQVADEIMEATKAKGVAVVIKAEHFCMTHRGVREHDSDMTTSVMLGPFREDPSLKAEFLQIVGDMK